MQIDLDTALAFQEQLDRIEHFVREEVEPLDHVLGDRWDVHNPPTTA
ncbi:hypothetical protein [Noviherbaspirillum pedocola]|uniref:Uncharacterized protein n=1 Tax=Noviherbaspirillum pedocola TaxID=2801341 RepID=A0A934W9V0_9BURK|nr:hypothetical protein [Noviherbaspirillum pedocola]MBK4738703.1 hypothetical protein [Noviherbaspirillum pedocola]